MRTRRSVTVQLHQFCPGGVDRCMTAFQAEGAGALPAPGTTGPRCPSGRVGFQIRPGSAGAQQRDWAAIAEPVGPSAMSTSQSRRTFSKIRTWPTSKAAVSKTVLCRSITCRPCQFFWRLGRSSDGAWVKTTRARRKTASLHHFIAGSGQFRRRFHKPAHSVQLGILLPLFDGA